MPGNRCHAQVGRHAFPPHVTGNNADRSRRDVVERHVVDGVAAAGGLSDHVDGQSRARIEPRFQLHTSQPGSSTVADPEEIHARRVALDQLADVVAICRADHLKTPDGIPGGDVVLAARFRLEIRIAFEESTAHRTAREAIRQRRLPEATRDLCGHRRRSGGKERHRCHAGERHSTCRSIAEESAAVPGARAVGPHTAGRAQPRPDLKVHLTEHAERRSIRRLNRLGRRG